MVSRSQVQNALDAGRGILRLEPCWVPRTFMQPGRRLRLHPDDLYALGAARGGINERWFSSTTNADNGPGTQADEGLSYVRLESGQRFQLKEAVDVAGDALIGADVMSKEQGWNILCKFFDNMGPIPHHMHQSDAHANWLAAEASRRRITFRLSITNSRTTSPTRSWASNLAPPQRMFAAASRTGAKATTASSTTLAHIACTLAAAGRSTPASCMRPARDLRAPGEQRRVRHVQSLVEGRVVPWDLLVKDVPKDKHQDLDFIVGMLDWDANVNPNFGRDNKVFPHPVCPFAESEANGYREQWVCYGTEWCSAKELTVLPTRTVTIRDAAACGLIVVQGEGVFGGHQINAPTMIRFGEMTQDELFVTADAARAGVRIDNHSASDPLVILKHFGPGNPDNEPLRRLRQH